MTQLVRTGYLLGTSSRRVLFNSASFALDFTTGFYKNAAGYVRTNLLKWSQDFASGWWTKNALTVTANTVSAPDGTVTADTITDDGTNGAHVLYGTLATLSGGGALNTASIYVKAGTARYIQFRGESTAANSWAWTVLDTQTGALSNNASVTSSTATPSANGWWRLTVTWANSNGNVGTANIVVGISNIATAPAPGSSLGNSYAGSGLTAYIWGAQVEATGYPSSYIPTTTAAASATTYTSTNPADVGNMTFTRASGGYAEDLNGNLVLFGSGVPRITSKGVLIEPAATNLDANSLTIGGTGWAVNASPTITQNAATAPDGSMTAARIQSTAIQSGPWRGGVPLSAGTTYTRSIWLKDNGGSVKTVQLGVGQSAFGGSGGDRNAIFNVSTGALTSIDAVYAATSVKAGAGGWWRVSLTFVPTSSTASGNFTIYGTASGADFFAWNHQPEAGASPTSDITTAGAAVTRAADVFYYSGASVTSSFTLAATIDHAFANNGSGFYPVVSIGGSYNNVAAIYRRDASSNYQGLIRSSAAATADMIAGGAPTTGVHFLALRVNDNQFALAKDGAIISTDTVGTSPALNGDRLAIGTESWSPGSLGVAGYIPRIAIYPYAASDAQLQSLSSGNFLL